MTLTKKWRRKSPLQRKNLRIRMIRNGENFASDFLRVYAGNCAKVIRETNKETFPVDSLYACYTVSLRKALLEGA